MKSQSAQLKVTMSSKCKMTASTLFRDLQFLCERENSMHQCSVLKGLGYNKSTYEQTCFASLREESMSPAVLAQAWRMRSGSLPLFSLATDALMIRERCWLLERKATQQIEQQMQNRSDNCILGTNYVVAGHVTGIMTTRRSPLRGVNSWPWD